MKSPMPYFTLSLTVILSLFLSLTACQSNTNSTRARPTVHGKPITPRGYHRVQRGENLYRISLRYHTEVATLIRLNKLTDGSQIEVGQLIKLPGGNYPAAAGGNTNTAAPLPQADNAAVSRLNFGWPLRGEVLSGFNGTTNKGIDIAAAAGSPVRAAQNGKVIYNDYVEGYGQLILLSHDSRNAVLTAYGNNRDTAVSLNQEVKKGQIIARVGENENGQPTLHFEIRSNGVAVNPAAYLK